MQEKFSAAFDSIGSQAPSEVKQAWKEAEEATGGHWIFNDGKHAHMIQLVVQFATKRLTHVTHNAMLKAGLHMSTFWR